MSKEILMKRWSYEMEGEHEALELETRALETGLKPQELVKLAEGFHRVAWKAFKEEL